MLGSVLPCGIVEESWIKEVIDLQIWYYFLVDPAYRGHLCERDQTAKPCEIEPVFLAMIRIEIIAGYISCIPVQNKVQHYKLLNPRSIIYK